MAIIVIPPRFIRLTPDILELHRMFNQASEILIVRWYIRCFDNFSIVMDQQICPSTGPEQRQERDEVDLGEHIFPFAILKL